MKKRKLFEERVSEVLNAIRELKCGTVDEIAKRVGLSRSRTQSLLNTLKRRNLVYTYRVNRHFLWIDKRVKFEEVKEKIIEILRMR